MRRSATGMWARGLAPSMKMLAMQALCAAAAVNAMLAQTPVPIATCPAAPAAGCVQPDRSSFKFLDRFGNGGGQTDKMIWKFLGGPAQPRSDFGDPTATTDIAFCVYEDSSLTIQAAVNETTSCSPLGPCCGPCWRAKGDDTYSFLYRALKQKITLKASSKPRTKILLKFGQYGYDYDSETLPFAASTVSIRLHNSDNANCWGADFPLSSFKKNDDQRFTAKIK